MRSWLTELEETMEGMNRQQQTTAETWRIFQQTMDEMDEQMRRFEKVLYKKMMMMRKMRKEMRSFEKVPRKMRTSEIYRESECVICLDSDANTRFLPCYHKCVCSSCLPSYREKFNICPICQGKFKRIIKEAVSSASEPNGAQFPYCTTFHYSYSHV